MADGASHLVDHVLPHGADYRQWTLSFPRWLRIRLRCDPALVSKVLLVFNLMATTNTARIVNDSPFITSLASHRR